MPLLHPRRIDARPTAHSTIAYVCEDVEDASLVARWFAEGFELSGWRRGVYRAVVIAAILLVTFAGLVLAVSLMDFRSMTLLAKAVIGAGIIAMSVWVTVGPLLMLHRWRITLAPWWLQSQDDDRLIEWRVPPRFSERSIKAVRYTGACPMCNSKVVVRSGGATRGWGLVGRCEEAPDAHVFSFDHVLRIGERRD